MFINKVFYDWMVVENLIEGDECLLINLSEKLLNLLFVLLFIKLFFDLLNR